MGVDVDDKPLRRQHLGFGIGHKPPRDRLQTQRKLVDGYRLDEIVVGAHLEPGDALRLARMRAEDGKVSPGTAIPRRPYHVKAAKSGHFDVHKRNVVVAFQQQRQAFPPVAGEVAFKPAHPNGCGSVLSRHLVVLYHKNLHFPASSFFPVFRSMSFPVANSSS